jgi:hypothetical protein
MYEYSFKKWLGEIQQSTKMGTMEAAMPLLPLLLLPSLSQSPLLTPLLLPLR